MTEEQIACKDYEDQFKKAYNILKGKDEISYQKFCYLTMTEGHKVSGCYISALLTLNMYVALSRNYKRIYVISARRSPVDNTKLNYYNIYFYADRQKAMYKYLALIKESVDRSTKSGEHLSY